jgi:hypothetical protein
VSTSLQQFVNQEQEHVELADWTERAGDPPETPAQLVRKVRIELQHGQELAEAT